MSRLGVDLQVPCACGCATRFRVFLPAPVVECNARNSLIAMHSLVALAHERRKPSGGEWAIALNTAGRDLFPVGAAS
jgi:hypothetical protein